MLPTSCQSKQCDGAALNASDTSLIILSPPPSLPLPISAPFLSFSWGTWLMCTLPLVVFLIASTPAQSAQCTHTHTVSHQASVKNAHNRHAKIHTRHTHEQKEANTYMDTVYVLAHPAAHTHTHTHTGEAVQLGQVLAISQHINHPPLNNLSVVLTVWDCEHAAVLLPDDGTLSVTAPF